MNDEPREVPTPPKPEMEQPHSICATCGAKSKPGEMLCWHCIQKLRSKAAGFKPYMEIVKKNRETQMPIKRRRR